MRETDWFNIILNTSSNNGHLSAWESETCNLSNWSNIVVTAIKWITNCFKSINSDYHLRFCFSSVQEFKRNRLIEESSRIIWNPGSCVKTWLNSSDWYRIWVENFHLSNIKVVANKSDYDISSIFIVAVFRAIPYLNLFSVVRASLDDRISDLICWVLAEDVNCGILGYSILKCALYLEGAGHSWIGQLNIFRKLNCNSGGSWNFLNGDLPARCRIQRP